MPSSSRETKKRRKQPRWLRWLYAFLTYSGGFATAVAVGVVSDTAKMWLYQLEDEIWPPLPPLEKFAVSDQEAGYVRVNDMFNSVREHLQQKAGGHFDISPPDLMHMHVCNSISYQATDWIGILNQFVEEHGACIKMSQPEQDTYTVTALHQSNHLKTFVIEDKRLVSIWDTSLNVLIRHQEEELLNEEHDFVFFCMCTNSVIDQASKKVLNTFPWNDRIE